jgi:integrase/recombinase XerD
VPTRAAADPETLLRAYLEHLQARRYSFSSFRKASFEIPRFFQFLKQREVRDVRRVDEADLVGYAAHLARTPTRRGQPLAPWSQSSALSTVKAFFDFLFRRGLILRNPAVEVPLPKAPRVPRGLLSESQARRLMNAPQRFTVAGRRDAAILETLYGTGIRLGECARIDVADLDLRGGTLFVKSGKGRKDRVVPISGRALSALDTYLREARPELAKHPRERALFISRFGRRFTTFGLRLLVQRHSAPLGIDVTPHVLRHACATHLLKGGADIRHIQKLLGHASIYHTAHYARVTPGHLSAVIERAHPRERRRRKRRGTIPV